MGWSDADGEFELVFTMPLNSQEEYIAQRVPGALDASMKMPPASLCTG